MHSNITCLSNTEMNTILDTAPSLLSARRQLQSHCQYPQRITVAWTDEWLAGHKNVGTRSCTAAKQPHPILLLQNSPTTLPLLQNSAPPHYTAAAKQIHKTASRYGTPQPSQRSSPPIVYRSTAVKQLEPLAKRARFYMFIVKPSIW